MKPINAKLSNYPRIHAFTAFSASSIKGQSVQYWMEELQDITITGLCECGECYTLYFSNSKYNEHFTHDHPCTTNFGAVTVVLHDRNDGYLYEIELPQKDNVPFVEEYKAIRNNSLYLIDRKALEAVTKWFRHIPNVPIFELMLE